MLDDGPGWVRGRSDPVGRPTQPQQTCGPVSKQSSLESQLALGGPESAHHREGMRGIGCPPPPHPPHPQGLRCMALNRGLGPHLLLRRVWRQSRSRGSGLLEASVQQLSPAQGIVRCAVTMSSVRPCSTPHPRQLRPWQFAGPQWPWCKVYTELLREMGSSREGGCGPCHPETVRRLMCRSAHHPSCLLSCHQDRSDMVCNACSHIHSHFDPLS